MHADVVLEPNLEAHRRVRGHDEKQSTVTCLDGGDILHTINWGRSQTTTTHDIAVRAARDLRRAGDNERAAVSVGAAHSLAIRAG